MDLITRLLHDDPEHRLGANGAAEVKAHPFFAGVDWETLLESGRPPFIPGDIKPDDPTYYFEGALYQPDLLSLLTLFR